jgi:2,4-dienoyl-CoA reductase-like NADH-dependent reductase (Old Yellow Enzyme family)/thioredoxin reductase
MEALEALFTPFRIGPLEIRNRIAMAPMATDLAGQTGAVTQRLIDYYAERAAGGVGLIIVESAHVIGANRDVCRIGIDDRQFEPGLAELAEAIQEKGAKAVCQLIYRENVTSAKRPDDYTVGELEAIVEAFGVAAKRARKVGFDAVEIHAANFYFLTQFMSPMTNHRQDAYGGSEEGRLKLATDILGSVRAQLGNEYPVLFRMIGDQRAPGGLDVRDGQRIARRLEAAGASALHVSAGSLAARFWHTPPMAVPRGCHVQIAAEIRKDVRIPVLTVGRINDPVLADRIIAEGKADMVVMGRALIADPELPNKAREGRLDEIRKCMACNHCRKRVIELDRTIRCAVNARAGRERDLRIVPAFAPKKVLVAGGGPGGLEAARVLALRGHQVVLYERAATLGGQLRLAVIPPYKEELRNLLEYLTSQIARAKVQVHLGSEATLSTLAQERPDAVIVATGALPLLPVIPGWDPARTFTAGEALEGRPMGEKLIVIGGGMVGCETAEHLATQGKRVCIVEKLPEIAMGVEVHTRGLLQQRLRDLGVEVRTSSEVVAARGAIVTLRNGGGDLVEVEADGIVAALGAGANRSLEDAAHEFPGRWFRIGDAQEAREIAAAVREGYLAALAI